MIVALTYVAGSSIILILLTFIYVIEDFKGKRVFFVGFRAFLDKVLTACKVQLAKITSFFTNGFMRLLLHYGAHSLLKGVLAWLRALEKRVEDLVRQNRKIAKDIHAAKKRNHLDEIAEHKEETALSDTQREDRLSH